MRYLTDVTRQDLYDIIRSGFHVSLDEPVKNFTTGQFDYEYDVYMNYNGRLSEIDFLERLYTLSDMPSEDKRFHNAKEDIWQHTINNDDWESFWFLSDDRFKLSKGNDDEPLLKFLCEMLNPVVRKEDSPWKDYLKKFNELLYNDGYEIYPCSHRSGRTVYSYHRLDFIEVDNEKCQEFTELKLIGSGSYANVYKYFDKRYNQMFALKRAKPDLNEKENERFIREFNDMKKLNSPYIVSVYSFDNNKNQYTMELADCSLADYIIKNNTKLNFSARRMLIMQLFSAFEYIHKKNLFHRDICPKNILIKQYEDTTLIKISDFGLVKEIDSELTSDLSDIKGYCNDPSLKIEGFKNYNILHEIYALTQVVVFIWTGKSNLSNIENPNIRSFFEKGMNADKAKRFQSLEEMKQDFLKKIR